MVRPSIAGIANFSSAQPVRGWAEVICLVRIRPAGTFWTRVVALHRGTQAIAVRARQRRSCNLSTPAHEGLQFAYGARRRPAHASVRAQSRSESQHR
jgi:hypothetical protein